MTTSKVNKPRITKDSLANGWWCVSRNVRAFGFTPALAWLQWVLRCRT